MRSDRVWKWEVIEFEMEKWEVIEVGSEKWCFLELRSKFLRSVEETLLGLPNTSTSSAPDTGYAYKLAYCAVTYTQRHPTITSYPLLETMTGLLTFATLQKFPGSMNYIHSRKYYNNSIYISSRK